jgi:MFS family permease
VFLATAPVIAPVAGGYIVSNNQLGWRWTGWVTLIISGTAFVIAVLFLPETYCPLLLDWKAKHLRRVTGDQRHVSKHAESGSFLKRTKQVITLPATFFGTHHCHIWRIPRSPLYPPLLFPIGFRLYLQKDLWIINEFNRCLCWHHCSWRNNIYTRYIWSTQFDT